MSSPLTGYYGLLHIGGRHHGVRGLLLAGFWAGIGAVAVPEHVRAAMGWFNEIFGWNDVNVF
jgi:hypothetical protein